MGEKNLGQKYMKPAIFLDRDGVICKERNLFYLGKPLINANEFEWELNSKEALGILSKLDFYLALITNQSSIGKGLMGLEEFHEINFPIYDALKNSGREFDGIYVCPHESFEGCNCRKPNLGMIELAKSALNINLEKSYVVGDKTTDIKLGENIGCKTALMETGYGGKDKIYEVTPDLTFKNLYEFSKFMEANNR